MRKNILLIVLMAAIFVFVGAISNSAKAAEDPVDLIRNAKTPVYLHSLDGLVHRDPSMISTNWHSIYPPATWCHEWHVIDERDNGTYGLNPSDKLKIEHVPDGSWIWVHVEEVTKTLILTLESNPLDTMYVEYTGGYDSLVNPATDPDYHPVSTWWHEIVPEFCTFYHLTSWMDDGNGELSFCDYIELTDTLNVVSSWHVEDVATDILVQSIPDPTVPTLTQWGVIILVLLILGSAIFIMLRRRKVPVPA